MWTFQDLGTVHDMEEPQKRICVLLLKTCFKACGCMWKVPSDPLGTPWGAWRQREPSWDDLKGFPIHANGAQCSQLMRCFQNLHHAPALAHSPGTDYIYLHAFIWISNKTREEEWLILDVPRLIRPHHCVSHSRFQTQGRSFNQSQSFFFYFSRKPNDDLQGKQHLPR